MKSERTVIHGDPGGSSKRRLIFIGDIHGCYDELCELLDRVAPDDRDVVVSLGDVVRKGPQQVRCLELLRDRHHLAVLGNNEVTLLQHAERPAVARLFLSPGERDVMARPDLLDLIRGWPLAIDFLQERVAAVHGGLLPQLRFDSPDAIADFASEEQSIIRLRRVRHENGVWRMVARDEEREDDPFWSERWDGDRFVVYGHVPRPEPRLDAHALGIDTGCVYGGRLTAAIHARGEWKTVGVKARRKYA